ncbi:hypothetical protein [Dyadobacter sp. CY356]|uniref:hypothetical protein n=1 Tax=Dyadobacter sp. CY356 TaxID=2906442 RepID=UPI001F16FEBC|nr:hypothetical protein [Dyadobacter sp. CY356]MCF0057009.1 hypothetical protein [Dyadobacter sp. CY356]
MLSIIILDNYPILRFGIAKLLKEHFKDVQLTEISVIDDIPKFHNTICPDLIVLGINDNTKKKDLKLYQEVKMFFPSTPTIVYDEIIYDFQTLPYLESGIEGYLLKQNKPAELLRSVEIVLSGKRYICNDVLQNLFYRFLSEESHIERNQVLLNLRNPA